MPGRLLVRLLGAGGLLLIIGAGCVQKDNASPAAAPTPPPSAPQTLSRPVLEVKDQTVMNDQVFIDRVVSAAPVWVVIHQVGGGAPGAVIGQNLVSAGENKLFSVAIQPAKVTEQLVAMLHLDRGTAGTFEFPGADAPLTGDDGKPVTVKFKAIKKPAVKNTKQDDAVPAELEAALDRIANENAAAAPVVVEMQARQWEFTPATVRVKKGARVQLKIKSIDVDHGLNLPDFKVNSKLVAGKTTVVSFTADKAGTFSFFCSVYCGEKHGEMRGTLIVEE